MILKDLHYTMTIKSHVTGKEAEHSFTVDCSTIDIVDWYEATEACMRKLVSINKDGTNDTQRN